MSQTSVIKESAGLSLEIQGRLSEVDRYNEWIYEQFRPLIGKRILDVGCAIGNITRYYLDRELVVGIDVVEEFINKVQERFADRPNFKVLLVDIADSAVLSLASEKIDTIICVNVLEHVEDDILALNNMKQVLVAGGRLLLLVPAFKFLYGTMDIADNHYRRYHKQMLRDRLLETGFVVESQYYMNLIGMLGWFLNGKILRNEIIESSHYSFYNKIVPVIAKMEGLVHPPFGLSLISVARKPQ